MAILKLHTYNKEKRFYETELSLVKHELEALNNEKEVLMENTVIEKKKDKTFTIKYNACAAFLGLLSIISEHMMPGLMVIMFGTYNILDNEINNLEGIKFFEDKLNNKELKKLYLQDKLYILELINKGYLKFELKGEEMICHSSIPIENLEYMELLNEVTFIPSYYKNKKINIKTLQKQIKIK